MNDDLQKLLEQVKRHIDVTAEAVRGDVRAVADGVLGVEQKLDDFRSEVNRRFDDTQALVKLS